MHLESPVRNQVIPFHHRGTLNKSPPTLSAFSVADALKALQVFARAASWQGLREQRLTRQRMYPTAEEERQLRHLHTLSSAILERRAHYP